MDEWWAMWKVDRSLDSPPVTWEEFKGVFMDHFIPRSMRMARAREFDLLKQDSMSVDEYDTKFIWLDCYTPHLVLNEREMIRQFILGLRHSLYQSVGP